MKARRENYVAYLNSYAWKEKRAEALFIFGTRCQECGSKVTIQVHHRHYESFEREHPADLEILCEDCHEEADRERVRMNTRRRRWARLNAWAKRVFGETWLNEVSMEAAEKEFIAWLRRKKQKKRPRR